MFFKFVRNGSSVHRPIVLKKVTPVAESGGPLLWRKMNHFFVSDTGLFSFLKSRTSNFKRAYLA